MHVEYCDLWGCHIICIVLITFPGWCPPSISLQMLPHTQYDSVSFDWFWICFNWYGRDDSDSEHEFGSNMLIKSQLDYDLVQNFTPSQSNCQSLIFSWWSKNSLGHWLQHLYAISRAFTNTLTLIQPRTLSVIATREHLTRPTWSWTQELWTWILSLGI